MTKTSVSLSYARSVTARIQQDSRRIVVTDPRSGRQDEPTCLPLGFGGLRSRYGVQSARAADAPSCALFGVRQPLPRLLLERLCPARRGGAHLRRRPAPGRDREGARPAPRARHGRDLLRRRALHHGTHVRVDPAHGERRAHARGTHTCNHDIPHGHPARKRRVWSTSRASTRSRAPVHRGRPARTLGGALRRALPIGLRAQGGVSPPRRARSRRSGASSTRTTGACSLEWIGAATERLYHAPLRAPARRITYLRKCGADLRAQHEKALESLGLLNVLWARGAGDTRPGARRRLRLPGRQPASTLRGAAASS